MYYYSLTKSLEVSLLVRCVCSDGCSAGASGCVFFSHSAGGTAAASLPQLCVIMGPADDRFAGGLSPTSPRGLAHERPHGLWRQPITSLPVALPDMGIAVWVHVVCTAISRLHAASSFSSLPSPTTVHHPFASPSGHALAQCSRRPVFPVFPDAEGTNLIFLLQHRLGHLPATAVSAVVTRAPTTSPGQNVNGAEVSSRMRGR